MEFERRLRKILRYLTLAVIFFTLWFLWPRELDSVMMAGDDQLAVPDYAMKNARYVSVRDGVREVESYAVTAAFDLIQRRMQSRDVRVDFYNEKGEVTKVTADKGTYLMDPRNFFLEGNVRAVSPDDFVLTGEEAVYRLSDRVLNSPKPVAGEQQAKNLKVWGDTAETNLNTRKVTLNGDARVHYIERKHGLTKVRGDYALLDRNEERVDFHRNVKVEQDKIVATGGESMLYYSKASDAVKYMMISSDVKILEHNGRYTRSQVAEFYAPTDTIVLSGFPSVYDGDDAVTGDKITLYRASGVVEVTGTNAAGPDSRLKEGQKRPVRSSEEDEELIP